MKNRNAKSTRTSDVSALRASPVHGLVAVQPRPMPIRVLDIEIDATNPGSTTQSLRNDRRAGSIRDSYDILARIIYPIIVCQNADGTKPYMHVDGYGRLMEAKARGQQEIEAIVYPPLTLEQRICLRQTLNAAQEPFDAVSIIRDLQELAKTRGLDISNPDHIKTLVRDLPERVRKHEKDLIMLARLHPTAVHAMGESYRKDGGTIGLDKFRNMARILRTMEDRHPKTVSRLGGAQELSLKLSKMYLDKKFSEGTRSQEAIRRVAKVLDEAPENDPRIADFFSHEGPYSEVLAIPAERPAAVADGQSAIVDACRTLTKLLVDVDVDSLTRTELRALERTESVLNKVLASTKA